MGLAYGMVASGSKESNDRVEKASLAHFLQKQDVLIAAHKHNALDGAAPVNREALRSFGFTGRLVPVRGDGDCWLSLSAAEGLPLGSDQSHWRSRADALVTEVTSEMKADGMQADLSDLKHVISQPGRPYLPESFAIVMAIK